MNFPQSRDLDALRETFLMKILWLKTELLHPVDKGGKIRTYHLLKQLKSRSSHHLPDSRRRRGAARRRESATEYCHDLIRIPHATRKKFSAGFYAELAST